MKFVSTRGKAAPLSFSEAIGLGLASDGGLFVPEKFPSVDLSVGANTSEYLLRQFFEKDALAPELPAILRKAFNFSIPLRFRNNASPILELFHGPTAAFKDVGARFLAECISHLDDRDAEHATSGDAATRTVIVATSGDTGGAVGGAFVGHKGIEVLILFPKGKISARQERQIACWGQNVRAIAVHGTFDDCQKVVKEALIDKELAAKKNFVSANSISVGRLLPQMTYYAKSSLEYRQKMGVTPNFIIPTGNLGNAVACLWAKKVGLPIGKVVLATNANDSIGAFLESGDWKPHATIATLANAMDVGNPSNMERLRALYPSVDSMRKDVKAVSVSDDEIKEQIRLSFKTSGDIFCPHTATALVAERKLDIQNAIIVSTAHPAKFETIVEPLIGQKIPVPTALAALLDRKSVFVEIEPTLAALKATI